MRGDRRMDRLHGTEILRRTFLQGLCSIPPVSCSLACRSDESATTGVMRGRVQGIGLHLAPQESRSRQLPPLPTAPSARLCPGLSGTATRC
jgi:hypothetical protein